MISSTTRKALLVDQSLIGAGAAIGRLQRVALSLTIIFACFSNAPVRAAEQGKTTQYYRAQALQNIAAGREEEAIDSYKSAIKAATAQYGKDSTYLSELYFEMGNLARSNGQSEIAKSYYQSAVTYRPNDIPARLQLADLERNTKNIREAFEDSKAAFKLNQSSPIARKGLMLCLQQSGRPAEAAQIAITLHRSGKTKLPSNISAPDLAPSSNESARAKTSAPSSAPESAAAPASEGGPIVTAAVSTPSPLHWAPNMKKKMDEAQAKKLKDEAAAEAAFKKKAEDQQKAENDKKTKEQHHKEELEKKSKQKSKKEEAQKKKDDSAKKASKTKPGFVEPEVNAASLKTRQLRPFRNQRAMTNRLQNQTKPIRARKLKKQKKQLQRAISELAL